MIFYVVTAEHSYTMKTYVTSWAPAPAARMQLVFYEELPQLQQLPPGTYIFSDLERLSPIQTEMATQVWEQLSRAGQRVRLLNHPARAMRRYDLLRKLYELGKNHFRVIRASDSFRSLRFPVFLREENEHQGNLTPLLHSFEELDKALACVLAAGYRRHDLVVVEFCDTSDASGIFRKYSAFTIGGQILPRHLIFSRNWVLKKPDLIDEEYRREEQAYLEQNPHEPWLREIFSLAQIDYGRIDYSFLGNEPQVWEINTNPMVKLLAARITSAFEAIDCKQDSGQQIPIAISTNVLRTLRAEKRKDAQRGLNPKTNMFPTITPGHPFYSHIQCFESLLNANPLYRAMKRRVDSGEETTIRALMKVRLLPVHGWDLKRVYLSFQYQDGSGPVPFHAATFFYSGKRRQIEYYEFPQDPCLTTAAPFFHEHSGREAPPDVIRYVPRQRLTFQTFLSSETDTPVIGKFMRGRECEQAYDRLVKISRAVSGSNCTFSVAAPRGIDEKKGVFFQEKKPGQWLNALINESNCKDLLYRVGIIHRDLHALDIRDLPQWDFGTLVQNFTTHIKWLSFFWPQQGPFFHEVCNLLQQQVPSVDPREYTFCHGDFRCPQVLKDNDHWSVIDFDASMRGDPYLDIARLMASLKYNVPVFADCFMDANKDRTALLEEACESYLNGYQERAQQALNRKRLLWHRICCEIHYLARITQRNLFHPMTFDGAIRLIQDLSERFRKEEGGDF